MRKAIVFEAERTGYGIDQLQNPMTVGELKAFLEDFDDDRLVVLSHDRGYTYGSLNLNMVSDYSEDEDGEWHAEDEWDY